MQHFDNSSQGAVLYVYPKKITRLALEVKKPERAVFILEGGTLMKKVQFLEH